MNYIVDSFYTRNNSNTFSNNFLLWLKIQEHDWLKKNKRAKSIRSLTGEDVTIGAFPVELKDNAVIVKSVPYIYENTETFKIKIEEAIWGQEHQ